MGRKILFREQRRKVLFKANAVKEVERGCDLWR